MAAARSVMFQGFTRIAPAPRDWAAPANSLSTRTPGKDICESIESLTSPRLTAAHDTRPPCKFLCVFSYRPIVPSPFGQEFLDVSIPPLYRQGVGRQDFTGIVHLAGDVFVRHQVHAISQGGHQQDVCDGVQGAQLIEGELPV